MSGNMFKCSALILSFCLIGELSIAAAPLNIQVHAEAAILMNADTGAILYEKNSHEQHYPASITKIATAIYALLKYGDKLDEIVVAQQDAVGAVSEEQVKKSNYSLPAYRIKMGSSHIGIKRGEKLTLRDLIYGMMLPSGNDAPNVIAQHIGGTIPQFMLELNAYLQSIGCTQTHFSSPHGLHHPTHYTTAYDMAILTKEALKNEQFREIISTITYKRPKTNMQDATTFVQTNRLLRKGPFYYPKAIGVKTGYGMPALHTFVGAATDQGRTLVAVLLCCKERDQIFKDTIALFEAAFNEKKVVKEYFKAGPQAYEFEIANAKIPTHTEKEFTLEYFPAEEPAVKAWLTWNKAGLPIKKGQEVGNITIQIDEQLVEKIPLLASAEFPTATLRDSKAVFWIIGVVLASGLAGIFLYRRQKKA